MTIEKLNNLTDSKYLKSIDSSYDTVSIPESSDLKSYETLL